MLSFAQDRQTFTRLGPGQGSGYDGFEDATSKSCHRRFGKIVRVQAATPFRLDVRGRRDGRLPVVEQTLCPTFPLHTLHQFHVAYPYLDGS